MLFAVVGVVALALTVAVVILIVQKSHTRNTQREVSGYPNHYALENIENGGDHNIENDGDHNHNSIRRQMKLN